MLTKIIALLLVAAVLLVGEVFIPSFGVLTLLAIIATIGACVLAFQISTSTGTTVLIIIGLVGPVFIWLLFKLFKKSPVVLTDSLEDQPPENNPYAPLLGKTGTASTVLRPAGKADIEGKRYDVVAQNAMIEEGDALIVSQVEGNKIVVKPHST